MAEFTFDTCPQWSDLNAWRQVLPNGDAELLDPATRRPLTSQYEWLTADPRLLKGVAFILQHAAEIRLTVVRGPHADASSTAEAEAVIARSHIIGLEGLGAWIADGPGPSSTNQVHFDRHTAAASERQTPTFVYDAQAESPFELDQLLCRMNTFWDPRYEGHPNQGHVTPVDRLDWFVASQALREPYIFGRYGYELSKHWSSLAERPVEAALLIGTGHENVPTYFERAGVTVEKSVERVGVISDQARILTRLTPMMIRAGLIPAGLRKSG